MILRDILHGQTTHRYRPQGTAVINDDLSGAGLRAGGRVDERTAAGWLADSDGDVERQDAIEARGAPSVIVPSFNPPVARSSHPDH